MENEKIKVLGLLSGGLDSHIATKLMVKLGYDVTVMNFMSPFCNCTKKSDGCKSAAHKIASESGVEIKTAFMGDEYLEIVRNPKYGYGSGVNPCLDCRIMMFTQAKKMMEKIGAKFIFTGEVLSQRPMSQMPSRLEKIEKETGLQGLIVRPLSAAMMEPTIPEKEGWINRDDMLAISGKSRKPQISVGRDMGIPEENLCSSGGCLLTDPHFSSKMRDLIRHTEKTDVKEARRLQVGRHFRLDDGAKVIVGRDKADNIKLENLVREDDTVIQILNFMGPYVVLSGKPSNGAAVSSVMTAARIAARYASAPEGAEVEVECTNIATKEHELLKVLPFSDDVIKKMRV
jgi:tRNA U34 2-thiouridine synthase MnmA/TrmU